MEVNNNNNNKYVESEEIKLLFEKYNTKINKWDLLKIYNKINNTNYKKIYQTNHKEDSDGYSDFLINVGKLKKNCIFIEETEVFPFKTEINGNPFLIAKARNDEKKTINAILKETNEPTEIYAFDFGLNESNIEKLSENISKSIEIKCKKNYIHNNKGTLILKSTFLNISWFLPNPLFEVPIRIDEKNKINFQEWEILKATIVNNIILSLDKENILVLFENSQFNSICVLLNLSGDIIIIDIIKYFKNLTNIKYNETVGITSPIAPIIRNEIINPNDKHHKEIIESLKRLK